MHLRRRHSAREPRRAVILMVVLALLTLFAIVGLAFVFYAQKQATASLNFRESQQLGRPDAPADLLAGTFLGQLLYDVPDGPVGVYSGLRGHSLARLVYGYNDGGSNATPFNGTGRLHAPGPLPNTDDYQFVNYTYFAGDGFVRDPERLGWRKDLSGPRGPYTGGFNVSYTYPDLNNMFLAAVKADGTVLAPSLHRPWLFNPGRALNDRTNPNWTNAAGKYLLLRPRPADMGPGFPYPGDATGDVKNLVDAPGGNDSVWIDLDFPVMQTPDGRKFKPLFAALISDLDGRVNLNAHGNVRGRVAGRPVHASNQGWGPWEVNLGRVLSRQASGADEWPNLLLGNAATGQAGRYGPDGKPGAAGSNAPFAQLFHFYAQADYDACQVRGGALVPTMAPFTLPGSSRVAFPSFPAGYDNGSGGQPLTERWEHPSLFSLANLQGDDRPFGADDLAGLLLGSQGGGSLLSSLCPQNFADPRLRRLVTTHSFDFDAPGGGPWIYDPSQSAYAVARTAADQAPTGPPLPFPPLALRNSAVPAGSEFSAPGLPPASPGVGWRALLPGLGSVDLNRPLTPYPLPVPQTTQTYAQRFDTPARAAQFQQAQRDRQQLAADIYSRLLRLTGVPSSATIPDQPTAAELQVRRWLAQLAVNIVDFIDEDDISTPFNFYTAGDAQFAPGFDPGALQWSGTPPAPDPGLPKYWVFGTELPHVVVNEVLAEYQDLPPPVAGGIGPTAVRAWVELHNPFQVPAAGQPLHPQDGFPVTLRVAAEPTSVIGKKQSYAPFQVVLATGLANRPRNDNVLGTAATVRTATADADFDQPVKQVNGQPQPNPSPSLAPGGFFLAGATGSDARHTISAAPKGTVPATTPWLQTTNLEYQHTFQPGQPEEKAAGITVLLRRLANPHLPFDPRPSVPDSVGEPQVNPWYNPYLTVDYLDKIPLQDGASTSKYAARGKRQPYAATAAQQADQVSPRPRQLTQHTFGRPNNPAPAAGRCDWLVHLDRELISPAELLHVSGYQPHQLTQRFIQGGGTLPETKFQHLVPWFDQPRRLYRLFEFVTARGRDGTGRPPGGRVAGKINLNTIWDPETFLALCDAQAANGVNFSAANVQGIYSQMLALRTPGGSPGASDRPFLSLATGYALPDGPGNVDPQHPGRGAGINDTLLRAADPTADGQAGGGAALSRLFQVPGETHPYRQDELLTKIFNNVTVRSNVFAVWLTVGFFEVTDDSTRPVKLGAEIGRATGTNVRHRLFALLDRTALAPDPAPNPAFDPRRDPAVLYFRVLE